MIKPIGIFLILVSLGLFNQAFAQGFGDSPFERAYQDVKYLDAYFGTSEEKMEVEPGDRNVPFTVVFANVGSQDITGIKGQLAMPIGFTSAEQQKQLIYADSDTNSKAGEVFYLTFFVDISQQAKIGQFPATVKVDYSRLRESGTRSSFFDFYFKVTGDSIINVRAIDPLLTSLQKNRVIVEIANDGTAPISAVDVILRNTEGTISSTSQSVTKVERVVILDSNWNVGTIGPGEKKQLEVNVYIPESMKSETLRAPLDITYFNTHGDKKTISRVVDFYVVGLVDLKVFGVEVIDLSGKPTIIGEIINEGNEDGLFGFVTIEPMGNSNIKSSSQFLDELETDSPIPFNIPIEFDGEPKYGEHDLKIFVRYKDSVRQEHLYSYETTIHIEEPKVEVDTGPDYVQFVIIPIVAIAGIIAWKKIKRKKTN